MKAIKFTSTLMLTLLLSARLWAQDGDKGQLVVPLSEPGKPYKLDVGLVNGSITVTGYDGKDIVIDAQGEERKHREKETAPGGMKRLFAGSNLDVQAQENNNTVSIHGSPMRTTNLTIKVPMNSTSVKLSTVNNGNIIAGNLSGDLEIRNVNGYIKLNNIAGSVVANTVNGNVEVTFKSIDAKAAMAFSTLNGKIDVTFPASLKANVKLKSDQGDVFTDFDVVTEQRKPVITKNGGEKGMYSLKMEDWVYGKIAGGGPELLMKTTFGSIYIRKAK
ncbi:DUF4097 family beta strand repeat-containing protein [Mucilaginibacter celer]|uniref:DUF4097 domain-containing protein n=1 Tax=Mucilaginibacter celer TaxID=2305508 RepID=A0A494VLD1_9SPHI|nr:DUF4097 family beta strand repeat-containing protein [Mucilaginibacter celer]AYL94889.1 hypothetical protein HYN43_006060 [Mucilaginibacter celer]